jgi:hypothetical protein
MPRVCTICSHPQKQEIDRAIIGGQSCREIGALFGVSPDAIQRHRTDHLPDKLVKAHDAEEVLSADALLAEMDRLRETLRNGLQAAEAAGSGAAIVSFAREYRAALESLFDITERIAARTGENDGPALKVVVERVGLPDTCPHCGKPIEPVVTPFAPR